MTTTIHDIATAGNVDVHPAPLPARHRLPLPDFGDLIFIALAGAFVFTNRRMDLLNDADTGWHIRNGSKMLASHVVTRLDSFSYIKFGHTWFAWEWLADLAMGVAYRAGGLFAVVSLSAVILALTFALLYRLLKVRCSDSLVAVVLTLIAIAASGMHMLARPHVLSWLLLTLVLYLLDDWERGGNKILLGLPILMLIWVNVHGGFLDGIIVGLIYILGSTLQREHRSIRLLAMAVGLGILATIVNPYGINLHVHIFHFLQSPQITAGNLEWASPDFHQWHERAFVLLILLVLTTTNLGRRRLRVTGWLILAYALTTALMSVRHLPLSSILIAYAGAPFVVSSLDDLKSCSGFLGATASWVIGRGRAYTRIESRLIPWIYTLGMTILISWVVFGPGKKPPCDFPPSFPAGAAAYLRQHQIYDRVFAPDPWGSYLIYELYPEFRAYIDGRSDFYGPEAMQAYRKVVTLSPQWAEVLKKGDVEWALLPVGSVHDVVFSESPDWTTIYRDPVAVLFQRRPSPGFSLAVHPEHSRSR